MPDPTPSNPAIPAQWRADARAAFGGTDFTGANLPADWVRAGASMRRDMERATGEAPTAPEPAPSTVPAEPRRDATGLGYVVPHHETFAAIWQLASRTYYSRFEESLKASWQDALAMNRDGNLYQLRRQRQLPSSSLRFRLVTDRPKDSEQKEIARQLTTLIERVPRFQRLKMALNEAIWPGKAGVAMELGKVRVDGADRVGVLGHKPVNGDKIIFGWDDVPAILVHSTWKPAAQEDEKYLIQTDRGRALRLADPFYRDRYLIHEFEPADTDFLYEGDLAGGIHGVGLRSRAYWTWFMRNEVLSWGLDAAQRISTNGQLVGYYDSGNDASKLAVIDALKSLLRDNVSAWPRQQGQGDAKTPGITRLDASSVAYDVLKQFVDYFDDILRLIFLGQNLSSEAGSTGLGSGVAELHEDTKTQIIKYDAQSLAETIDEQLVRLLIRLNRWSYRGRVYDREELPFGVRFEFVTEEDGKGSKEALDAANVLFNMGIELDKDELREKAGLSAPQDPGNSVGGQPQPQPGPPGMPPGAPPGKGERGSGIGDGESGQPPAPSSQPPRERYARKPAAGQSSFGWDEDAHPRDHGQFASKPGATDPHAHPDVVALKADHAAARAEMEADHPAQIKAHAKEAAADRRAFLRDQAAEAKDLLRQQKADRRESERDRARELREFRADQAAGSPDDEAEAADEFRARQESELAAFVERQGFDREALDEQQAFDREQAEAEARAALADFDRDRADALESLQEEHRDALAAIDEEHADELAALVEDLATDDEDEEGEAGPEPVRYSRDAFARGLARLMRGGG